MHTLWNQNWSKVYNFINVYISPNQSLEELETFADNLNLNLAAVGKSGLFNCSSWWP